jgi:hypothetical protein
MFLLGFIAATCFIPGVTGMMVPVQWAVLSILLPLGLWRFGYIGLDHKLGLALLGWATLSLSWAPNIFDALYGLWIVFMWAGTFWFAGTNPEGDSRPLWCGLAAGLAVNSGVAIAQALGYTPVLSNTTTPAGLLFNPTMLGACCALVIIALISWREWFYIPFLVPGLVLSQSRGAMIVLAFTALAMHVRWYITLAAIGIGFGLMAFFAPPSDLQRLFLWGYTLRNLDLLGHGIGSYNTLLVFNPTEFYPRAAGMIHPEFVHNDYLQLWFELGIGAVLAYTLLVRGLLRTQDPDWPVLCGFAILATFYFPLYGPLLMFIGCSAAGSIASRRIRGGDFVHNGGPVRLPWLHAIAARIHRDRGQALPIQPST